MRILVAGSTGFIGTALVEHLEHAGHEIHRLVRCMPKNANEHYWDPESKIFDSTILNKMDALVNLAGASVGKKRWTKKYKETIFTSRIKTTQTLVDAIKKTSTPPRCFINASATGFYGNRPGEILTETSSAGQGFLSEVCARWENVAMNASDTTRTVTIRTGMVLDQIGGTLHKLLPLFKWQIGGKLGAGQQWWSWISLVDQVRAIEFLLTNETISGPVNLVSPEPVEMQAFSAAFMEKLQGKKLFDVPKKILDIALGEMGQELVFSSQQVQPQILTQAGFAYTHANLDSLVAWVLEGKNIKNLAE